MLLELREIIPHLLLDESSKLTSLVLFAIMVFTAYGPSPLLMMTLYDSSALGTFVPINKLTPASI